jgi:hypothetical protein
MLGDYENELRYYHVNADGKFVHVPRGFFRGPWVWMFWLEKLPGLQTSSDTQPHHHHTFHRLEKVWTVLFGEASH